MMIFIYKFSGYVKSSYWVLVKLNLNVNKKK